MYKGSCLCGKVTFEIHEQIKNIVYCHCSLCRKAQGSAFAANGNVSRDGFSFKSGQQALTEYQASPGHSKFFCKHCGSPIMSTNSATPDKIRVRLGTIESDIKERPMAHIFASSKANWENICDDLPQYEFYEPER
ncbi:MAG: GFA family protein [Gammaproteobacteria bacterium]|nr:GFA family protein [Gammaproteobacteria bacterium]